MNSPSKNHKILVMWDMYGLESIHSIDDAMLKINEWEKESIFKTLKDEPSSHKPNPIPLNVMIMRARINSQRSYEIYSFNSTFSIEEVKELFRDRPQVIANWIRENGYKIYSDYSKNTVNQKIT